MESLQAELAASIKEKYDRRVQRLLREAEQLEARRVALQPEIDRAEALFKRLETSGKELWFAAMAKQVEALDLAKRAVQELRLLGLETRNGPRRR